MTKSTITKTWIGGLIAFAAGTVVSLVGVFMLALGGTFTQTADTSNYNFRPSMNGAFWTGVAVIVVGGAIAVIGGGVQLVAWIGALFNSYRLADKTWFLILLLGGLLSFVFAPFGLAAMIAYVVAAPDGAVYGQNQGPTAVQQPGPLARSA